MTLSIHWKKPVTLLAIAAVTLSTSMGALAHGATKPAHGGIVQMSGETLFELVVEPADVALYVIDEDDEVAASGMSAKLVIHQKGAKREVTMNPGAGNKFEAKGVKVSPGSQVSVLVTNNTTLAKTSADFTVK